MTTEEQIEKLEEKINLLLASIVYLLSVDQAKRVVQENKDIEDKWYYKRQGSGM